MMHLHQHLPPDLQNKIREFLEKSGRHSNTNQDEVFLLFKLDDESSSPLQIEVLEAWIINLKNHSHLDFILDRQDNLAFLKFLESNIILNRSILPQVKFLSSVLIDMISPGSRGLRAELISAMSRYYQEMETPPQYQMLDNTGAIFKNQEFKELFSLISKNKNIDYEEALIHNAPYLSQIGLNSLTNRLLKNLDKVDSDDTQHYFSKLNRLLKNLPEDKMAGIADKLIQICKESLSKKGSWDRVECAIASLIELKPYIKPNDNITIQHIATTLIECLNSDQANVSQYATRALYLYAPLSKDIKIKKIITGLIDGLNSQNPHTLSSSIHSLETCKSKISIVKCEEILNVLLAKLNDTNDRIVALAASGIARFAERCPKNNPQRINQIFDALHLAIKKDSSSSRSVIKSITSLAFLFSPDQIKILMTTLIEGLYSREDQEDNECLDTDRTVEAIGKLLPYINDKELIYQITDRFLNHMQIAEEFYSAHSDTLALLAKELSHDKNKIKSVIDDLLAWANDIDSVMHDNSVNVLASYAPYMTQPQIYSTLCFLCRALIADDEDDIDADAKALILTNLQMIQALIPQTLVAKIAEITLNIAHKTENVDDLESALSLIMALAPRIHKDLLDDISIRIAHDSGNFTDHSLTLVVKLFSSILPLLSMGGVKALASLDSDKNPYFVMIKYIAQSRLTVSQISDSESRNSSGMYFARSSRPAPAPQAMITGCKRPSLD